MLCPMLAQPLASQILLLLLLLSGDIETNPGPKKGEKKEKGPTVEDQINDLKTALTEYEDKIKGMFPKFSEYENLFETIN